MKTDWLEKLKVGDKVIVNTRMGRSIRVVEKITPAGNFKLDNGSIYNKDGSERNGDSWNRCYLSEATPEVVQDIHNTKLIHYVKQKMKNVQNLSVEQAKAILKILSVSEGKGNETNNN